MKPENDRYLKIKFHENGSRVLKHPSSNCSKSSRGDQITIPKGSATKIKDLKGLKES